MRPITMIAVLLITACTSIPFTNTETINGLVINNQTNDMVYKVRLNVPETTAVIECSSIPPQRNCALGFPDHKNEHHTAFLSWEQNGYPYKKELKGDTVSQLDKTRPSYAVVNIFDHGQLEAHMEQ